MLRIAFESRNLGVNPIQVHYSSKHSANTILAE
jgi:hypothetical protein